LKQGIVKYKTKKKKYIYIYIVKLASQNVLSCPVRKKKKKTGYPVFLKDTLGAPPPPPHEIRPEFLNVIRITFIIRRQKGLSLERN